MCFSRKHGWSLMALGFLSPYIIDIALLYLFLNSTTWTFNLTSAEPTRLCFGYNTISLLTIFLSLLQQLNLTHQQHVPWTLACSSLMSCHLDHYSDTTSQPTLIGSPPLWLLLLDNWIQLSFLEPDNNLNGWPTSNTNGFFYLNYHETGSERTLSPLLPWLPSTYSIYLACSSDVLPPLPLLWPSVIIKILHTTILYISTYPLLWSLLVSVGLISRRETP